MATFRDLFKTLQALSDEQLDKQVRIIPTGYCSEAEVDINGYSPFSGTVEIAISKGDIIYEEGFDSPQCGSGICGCSDTEEWDVPASELAKDLAPGDMLYSKDAVLLGPGSPYIRISD